MSKVKQVTTVDLGSGLGGASGSYVVSTGAGSTVTMDPSLWNGSITLPGATVGGISSISNIPSTSYNWTTSGATSTTTGYSFNTTPSTVRINTDGLTMADGTDITVGGKSLTKAIEQIEERLGILHPNPALEERWDKLKDLRRQYIEMEKDILEKEKIMKILKES